MAATKKIKSLSVKVSATSTTKDPETGEFNVDDVTFGGINPAVSMDSIYAFAEAFLKMWPDGFYTLKGVETTEVYTVAQSA